MRLLSGMLTPAMRAISSYNSFGLSALALLVTRVLADDQHHPTAADDLALLAHGLDRGSYLHVRPILKRLPCRPQELGGRALHRCTAKRRARLVNASRGPAPLRTGSGACSGGGTILDEVPRSE